MEIILNKQVKRVSQHCTLQQLADEMIPEKQNGVAIAINAQVIAKKNWESHLLKPNDDVLIIKATQGG